MQHKEYSQITFLDTHTHTQAVFVSRSFILTRYLSSSFFYRVSIRIDVIRVDSDSNFIFWMIFEES